MPRSPRSPPAYAQSSAPWRLSESKSACVKTETPPYGGGSGPNRIIFLRMFETTFESTTAACRGASGPRRLLGPDGVEAVERCRGHVLRRLRVAAQAKLRAAEPQLLLAAFDG